MEQDRKKVLLGLSGGVDSTAAALLLMEKGYKVMGFFMDMTGQSSEEALRAEKTASEIGIPFMYKDLSMDFDDKVINYFCNTYQAGETPNPCVFCNPTVKFAALIEEADRNDIYWIGTGHYARVCNGFICKATNRSKDQSYMLYRLGQDVIERLLLPLGESTSKDTLREYVRDKGVSNADRKDSQEICFIADGEDYAEFMHKRGIVSTPGQFVDSNGAVLGIHKGLINYTVGQRKGLGETFGKRMFVTKIDPDKNQIILGTNDDLFSKDILIRDFIFTGVPDSFMLIKQKYGRKKLEAKIRYSAASSMCRLYFPDNNRILVHFLEPQRAATPGQSIVFYEGDCVIGGGIITRS